MFELHRHLDVSTRPATLLEFAQRLGLEGQSTSLESFKKKIQLKTPLSDLSSVLATFVLFQKVLDRPEAIERAAFEVAEDCHREGITHAELRYAPNFVSEYTGLDWGLVLDAFERGLARARVAYPELRTGIICIAARDYGVDEVARTVEFYLRHSSRFIGLDLAGNEDRYPCRLFESAFRPAKSDPRSRITVHAGEGSGPENIWEAIELLGARRIGHGISYERDPRLAEELKKRQICLEMCPTSNWLTQATPTLRNHPLPRALRAGIPVCINTDDPGVFDVTLGHEMEICRTEMGMNQAELDVCQEHARRASFF